MNSIISDEPRSPGHEAPEGHPARVYLMAAVALCLAGIGVSLELTRIHVKTHLDPTYHSICAVSQGVNCQTVALSPASVFAGVPVSVWGLAAYLAMGILALWSLGRHRLGRSWGVGLLLVLTGLASAVSAVLAYVSIVQIDSICLFCMASYGINAVLLVLAILAVRRTRQGVPRALVSDVTALVQRPALAGALGLVGVGAVVALVTLVPPYWKAPAFSGLPRLAAGQDAGGHHWTGAREPLLEIVEFSDYQCPYCRVAHRAVRELCARYPREVRLVHRHLPLDQACHPRITRRFHPRACQLAEAAECAGLQGRFWEMNDALFAIHEHERPDLVDPLAIAARLGLDRAKLRRCLQQHEMAGRIQKDIQAALKLGLRGTPTFVVGDQVLPGRVTEAVIRRLLEERRNRQRQSRSQG